MLAIESSRIVSNNANSHAYDVNPIISAQLQHQPTQEHQHLIQRVHSMTIQRGVTSTTATAAAAFEIEAAAKAIMSVSKLARPPATIATSKPQNLYSAQHFAHLSQLSYEGQRINYDLGEQQQQNAPINLVSATTASRSHSELKRSVTPTTTIAGSRPSSNSSCSVDVENDDSNFPAQHCQRQEQQQPQQHHQRIEKTDSTSSSSSCNSILLNRNNNNMVYDSSTASSTSSSPPISAATALAIANGPGYQFNYAHLYPSHKSLGAENSLVAPIGPPPTSPSALATTFNPSQHAALAAAAAADAALRLHPSYAYVAAAAAAAANAEKSQNSPRTTIYNPVPQRLQPPMNSLPNQPLSPKAAANFGIGSRPMPASQHTVLGPPSSALDLHHHQQQQLQLQHQYSPRPLQSSTASTSLTNGTYITSSKSVASPTSSNDSNSNSDSSYFKVPSSCGKEGSLKHRFLARPTTLPPERVDDQQQQHQEPCKSAIMKIHNTTSNFRKGSYIELATGVLRRVEDMRTEDFIQCAERSAHHDLAEPTVVKIDGTLSGQTVVITFTYDRNRSKADIEVTPDHPFFVYGQGWASCDPEKSFKVFGLKCQRLQVGDICISLTPKTVALQKSQTSTNTQMLTPAAPNMTLSKPEQPQQTELERSYNMKSMTLPKHNQHCSLPKSNMLASQQQQQQQQQQLLAASAAASVPGASGGLAIDLQTAALLASPVAQYHAALATGASMPSMHFLPSCHIPTLPPPGAHQLTSYPRDFSELVAAHFRNSLHGMPSLPPMPPPGPAEAAALNDFYRSTAGHGLLRHDIQESQEQPYDATMTTRKRRWSAPEGFGDDEGDEEYDSKRSTPLSQNDAYHHQPIRTPPTHNLTTTPTNAKHFKCMSSVAT